MTNLQSPLSQAPNLTTARSTSPQHKKNQLKIKKGRRMKVTRQELRLISKESQRVGMENMATVEILMETQCLAL